MKLAKRVLKNTIAFLLYKWLLAIVRLIRAYILMCRKRKDRMQQPHRIRHNVSGDCAPIKAINYKRADPSIYSQHYLMKFGMAVTWDNPDIQMYEEGNPVSSHQLRPSTTYELKARIWNASTEAPVVGMPVKFSYLDFGAGTISIPIADTSVNVGVLVGTNNPSFATVSWTTPNQPGHYCIQVKLIWPDDINPDNNIGQENTNVVNPSSPAKFNFQVLNNDEILHRYTIEMDCYEIQEINCREIEKLGKKDRKSFFINKNQRENFPVPANWKVEIFKNNFSLAPGEEMKVEGQIISPDDFKGKKAFNFNVL